MEARLSILQRNFVIVLLYMMLEYKSLLGAFSIMQLLNIASALPLIFAHNFVMTLEYSTHSPRVLFLQKSEVFVK